MKFTASPSFIFACLAAVSLFSQYNTAAFPENLPKEIHIIQQWSGDYPVAELKRLPANQQKGTSGYLGDGTRFRAVWEAFKPGEKVPAVDFDKHLVVLSRNVDFYNRTTILKVTLSNGTAEVLAMETMSSNPIEDKVAMALAVIPRTGVRFIQLGNRRISVERPGRER